VIGRVYKFGLCLCAALLSVGCGGRDEPVVLDLAGVAPKVDYSELDEVLGAVVRKDGLLDAEAFGEVAGRLEVLLKRLAVTGPTATPALFPTDDEALAYWYNARAAWAIKLASLYGFPKRLDRRRLYDRAFTLDGRSMTLADIDEAILTLGGWKAVVAAPGIMLDSAVLPRSGFRAEQIRRRIDRRFNEFIDDPRRFVIDIEAQKLRVPSVLYRFAPQLIDQYNKTYGTRGATLTTALLPHVTGSAARRLQDAMGYRCVKNTQTGRLAVFSER